MTGVERFFPENEIIVSKTDLKGRITYANKVFLDIAGYSEKETVGQPHSLIRHPQMPRCIFKLMWETIEAGQEIFAYVLNRTKNGDHYWAYAHVTPSFGPGSEIIGYHSNRRVPDRAILENHIIPLYKDLLAEEARPASRKDGMQAAFKTVETLLEQRNMAYDAFIATLGQSSLSGATMPLPGAAVSRDLRV